MTSIRSKVRRCSAFAIAAAPLVTRFYVLDFSLSSSVPISTASSSSHSEDNYCSSSVGSLHSIALEMVKHSSPPGSKSYNKLKHVLDLSTRFYVNLGPSIFQQNEENMAKLLEGYGLIRSYHAPNEYSNRLLLVETIYSSACSIKKSECATRPRILIQSEQIGYGDGNGQSFINAMSKCNNSPNCVIFEFSEYNYEKAVNEPFNFGDSFVLLPVMTQSPSRLAPYHPKVQKRLEDRVIDIVFFGLITARRRKILIEKSFSYLRSHPKKIHVIEKVRPNELQMMADAYTNSKICLVAHAFSDESGGEYHRLSEIAGFGCIPLMERFADTIGMERYEECGGVIFSGKEDLFETAMDIIAKIDQGIYGSRAKYLDWWNTGIDWGSILTSMYV